MKRRPAEEISVKHRLLAVICVAALAAGCRNEVKPAASGQLDAIARDYVLLSLTIGEKEDGYIDAYYGPPELQAKAKADAPGQSLDALARRADELSGADGVGPATHRGTRLPEIGRATADGRAPVRSPGRW